MFNAKQLLDQFVQAAQGLAAPATAGTASSQQSAGIPGLGGLGDLVGGLGSGLSGLLKNPSISGALSGVGGGMLAGLLFGNKGGSIGGKVATIGGAAALGTLALNAFRKWQASQASGVSAQNVAQEPQSQQFALGFDNLSEAKQEAHSHAMLTAIIAAAKADGQIDAREQQLIQKQFDGIDDPETKAWIQQEIQKPLDVDEVAAFATSPEMAASIYLSSLIVIDDQNELEKKYLDSLAQKMNLDPQLRVEIEQQLAAQQQ
jgi:uncharacterized membrane protein YebE (DUF533 family)